MFGLSPRGQTALETFLAVFVIMGIFLSISLISAQRNAYSNYLLEQDQNIAFCSKLSYIIDRVDTFTGYTTQYLYLEKHIEIARGTISLGGNSGVYCYYTGDVVGDDPGFTLLPGVYRIEKKGGGINFISSQPPA